MKKTLYITALFAALSMTAFGGDWSGKLLDASCTESKETSKTTSCDATTATTSFAIDVAGKVYKLDSAGNTKAAAAIKSRADRSSDPAKALTAVYNAKVSGTEKNGVIDVSTVEIQ
jgi:hypothetical protein